MTFVPLYHTKYVKERIKIWFPNGTKSSFTFSYKPTVLVDIFSVIMVFTSIPYGFKDRTKNEQCSWKCGQLSVPLMSAFLALGTQRCQSEEPCMLTTKDNAARSLTQHCIRVL